MGTVKTTYDDGARQDSDRATSLSRIARTCGAPGECKNAESPANAGLSGERLMGFEPTTFCMASRRSSQLSYSRTRASV